MFKYIINTLKRHGLSEDYLLGATKKKIDYLPSIISPGAFVFLGGLAGIMKIFFFTMVCGYGTVSV